MESIYGPPTQQFYDIIMAILRPPNRTNVPRAKMPKYAKTNNRPKSYADMAELFVGPLAKVRLAETLQRTDIAFQQLYEEYVGPAAMQVDDDVTIGLKTGLPPTGETIKPESVGNVYAPLPQFGPLPINQSIQTAATEAMDVVDRTGKGEKRKEEQRNVTVPKALKPGTNPRGSTPEPHPKVDSKPVVPLPKQNRKHTKDGVPSRMGDKNIQAKIEPSANVKSNIKNKVSKEKKYVDREIKKAVSRMGKRLDQVMREKLAKYSDLRGGGGDPLEVYDPATNVWEFLDDVVKGDRDIFKLPDLPTKEKTPTPTPITNPSTQIAPVIEAGEIVPIPEEPSEEMPMSLIGYNQTVGDKSKPAAEQDSVRHPRPGDIAENRKEVVKYNKKKGRNELVAQRRGIDMMDWSGDGVAMIDWNSENAQQLLLGMTDIVSTAIFNANDKLMDARNNYPMVPIHQELEPRNPQPSGELTPWNNHQVEPAYQALTSENLRALQMPEDGIPDYEDSLDEDEQTELIKGGVGGVDKNYRAMVGPAAPTRTWLSERENFI